MAAAPGRRWWIAVLGSLAIVGAGGVSLYLIARSDRVASDMTVRAEQVMPFDLDRTIHTFTKIATGGVETVVVKDPADDRNLALIRSHLRTESEQFRKGDYSDPAKIHGMDMPGMKQLAEGADRVNVVYEDVPGGAQITYSSTEPALVSAIHAWFDRQTADHRMIGMGGG